MVWGSPTITLVSPDRGRKTGIAAVDARRWQGKWIQTPVERSLMPQAKPWISSTSTEKKGSKPSTHRTWISTSARTVFRALGMRRLRLFPAKTRLGGRHFQKTKPAFPGCSSTRNLQRVPPQLIKQAESSSHFVGPPHGCHFERLYFQQCFRFLSLMRIL